VYLRTASPLCRRRH